MKSVARIVCGILAMTAWQHTGLEETRWEFWAILTLGMVAGLI